MAAKPTKAKGPKGVATNPAPSVLPPSPTNVVCATDPGDDTQRNFRYQHAYGLILLLNAAANVLPYISVYCEHHEDLLAERTDGRFDAYQVKTRRPEQGDWQWNHDDLSNSVRRFVNLEQQFDLHLARYFFVSNSECLDSADKARIHLSPHQLIREAKGCASPKSLPAAQRGSFSTLRAHCGCDEDILFRVLQRLELKRGPSREDFQDVLAHSHLAKVPPCENLSAARLNYLRDELLSLIFLASSRAREDSSRHVLPHGPELDDVVIRSKRVLLTDVTLRLQETFLPPFRYTAKPELLNLGSGNTKLSVLEQKLIHADLRSQFDTLQRRALNAEQYLIERAHAAPDPATFAIDHVISTVKADCDEAFIGAKLQTLPVGFWMLNEVYKRLRARADHDAASVDRLPFEVLAGIAALLTEECKVWWGDPFDLSEKAA